MTTIIAPEVSAFVEQFVIAVDFQKQVPVSAETPLDSLPEWDSLAALGVIVMCDSDYGASLRTNSATAGRSPATTSGHASRSATFSLGSSRRRLPEWRASRSTTSDSGVWHAASRKPMYPISTVLTQNDLNANDLFATSGF